MLADHGGNCIDVDECELNDPCENPNSDGISVPWSDCFNTEGSYNCVNFCDSGQSSSLFSISKMSYISLVI